MRYYGADYYPEQETREEVLRDAHRLREQGFNAVRIGEFAWSVLEPEEGQYNIDWLVDMVNILGSEGVYTIVCTPSACPPIWMVEKHPDILYRDNRGVVRPFGGRRHYCYNNDTYREYCRKITEKIAQALQGNPYLLGWHIDNELAQEATGRCQCPVCQGKFHAWMERKYGTIEEFNRRAGTVFWSQTYSRFDQIPLPSKSIEVEGADPLYPFLDNPTIRLDFERFSSDSMVDFVRNQAEVLRRYTTLPLTTNTTGVWTSGLNYYDAFKQLDIVAVDEYPSLRSSSLAGCSASFAFIRGIKGQQDFWVVETSSGGGQGSWARQGVPQPYPGALRQAAIHAYASGAQLLTYFQYKTFRYGAEQLEASVMDIDGVERRRNREFRQVAQELEALTPLLESTVLKNDVAVCFDYDCLWAIKIKPFHKQYYYPSDVLGWHGLLKSQGLDADIIPMDDAIFRYKVVVLTGALVLSDAFKEQLKEFVRRGGVVVAGYLTAIKNPDNTADRVSTPAGLTDLFGLRVEEIDPVYANLEAQMTLTLGDKSWNFTNRIWTESLGLDTAQPLMTYDTTYRQGETAAACNAYGDGKAYYLGTVPGHEVLGPFMKAVCEREGIKAVPFTLPGGTEVIARQQEGKPVYFVFNSNEGPATIGFQLPCRDWLSGEVLTGDQPFEAKAYRVVVPVQ